VLPHVVALWKAFDARVTLLRVLGRSLAGRRDGFVDPLDWHITEAAAGAYLEGVAGRLADAGLSTEQALLTGKAAEKVVAFAHDDDVDLIVLSSHGKSGLSGWNVSSVVQKIILRAYVSTMIVRAYQPVASSLGDLVYRRVLVPLDCSQRAECVLPIAAALAKAHRTELLLAHVVRKPEMPRRAPPTPEDLELSAHLTERNREEASRCLGDLRARLALDADTALLIREDVAAALHELAEEREVDLVLLTAHGYSGTPRWPYGSVATSFVAYGLTPLLIVQDLQRDQVRLSQAEIVTQERKGH
jgi:nucleotide-binding universal stress UspA family protein